RDTTALPAEAGFLEDLDRSLDTGGAIQVVALFIVTPALEFRVVPEAVRLRHHRPDRNGAALEDVVRDERLVDHGRNGLAERRVRGDRTVVANVEGHVAEAVGRVLNRHDVRRRADLLEQAGGQTARVVHKVNLAIEQSQDRRVLRAVDAEDHIGYERAGLNRQV